MNSEQREIIDIWKNGGISANLLQAQRLFDICRSKLETLADPLFIDDPALIQYANYALNEVLAAGNN